MNKNNLIKKIKSQLDQLATTGANIQQEPYKSDLFKIFIEAAELGFDFDLGTDNMHADVLGEDLVGAGIDADDSNLSHIRSMWHEWSYCRDKLLNSNQTYGHASTTAGNGFVTAQQVSINTNGGYAHPSSGYPRTAQISLGDFVILNKGPITLVAPHDGFPLNAPVKNVYLYKGVLFGL